MWAYTEDEVKMMKQKWVVYFIVICCAYISAHMCNAEIDEAKNVTQLRELSMAKAVELCSVVSKEGFKDQYMNNLDPLLREMIINIEPLSPDYMFVLSVPPDLDLNSALDEYALTETMGATFCFDVIYDTNSIFSERSFAEWADHISIYDVNNQLGVVPPVVYTVLVYSEDAPQIVTAFFRHNDSMWITKTSFVYNMKIEPDSIYAAFPIIASNIWHDLDSTIIEMKK